MNNLARDGVVFHHRALAPEAASGAWRGQLWSLQALAGRCDKCGPVSRNQHVYHRINSDDSQAKPLNL